MASSHLVSLQDKQNDTVGERFVVELALQLRFTRSSVIFSKCLLTSRISGLLSCLSGNSTNTKWEPNEVGEK